MPFQIIRNDITKVKADIIVNTANPQPMIGSGTDSVIYNAAGADDLLAERKKIGNIKSGEAAVTPAFGLSAKYMTLNMRLLREIPIIRSISSAGTALML